MTIGGSSDMVPAWLVAPLAEWMKAANPEATARSTEFSTHSANIVNWYVSAEDHAADVFLFAIPFVLISVFLLATADFRGVACRDWLGGDQRPVQWRRYPHGWLDRILGFLCVFCTGEIVAFKAAEYGLVFLLQPCHIQMAQMAYLLCIEDQSWFAELLLNYTITTYFGAVQTLFTPDIRDRVIVLDLVHFFMSHVILAVVPAYLAVTRRSKVHTSWSSLLLNYCLLGIFHFVILEWTGLLGDKNINYMFQPPKPLLFAGRWFRFMASLYALLGVLFTRPILTRYIGYGWLWLERRLIEADPSALIDASFERQALLDNPSEFGGLVAASLDEDLVDLEEEQDIAADDGSIRKASAGGRRRSVGGWEAKERPNGDSRVEVESPRRRLVR